MDSNNFSEMYEKINTFLLDKSKSELLKEENYKNYKYYYSLNAKYWDSIHQIQDKYYLSMKNSKNIFIDCKEDSNEYIEKIKKIIFIIHSYRVLINSEVS